MRGKKLILLLMLAGLLQTGTSQSERQVRKFVRQQLSWYPHLHLLDLYKSCYQDFMGAEHLVTNSEVANYYVQKELSEMDTAAYVQGFLEPCGLYGNYMRVPLAFVKNGTVPADSLVSWFVQSSGPNRPTRWRNGWLAGIRSSVSSTKWTSSFRSTRATRPPSAPFSNGVVTPASTARNSSSITIRTTESSPGRFCARTKSCSTGNPFCDNFPTSILNISDLVSFQKKCIFAPLKF